MEELLLVPTPRRVQRREGRLEVPPRGCIRVLTPNEPMLRAARLLLDALEEAGCRGWRISAGAYVSEIEGVFDLGVDGNSGAADQGYALEVTPRGAAIRGHDLPGAFYGACTLRQMLRQFGAALPCVSIEDSPAFPVRGFLLDVSRGKVPTMETLRAMVDLLAGLKVNQLQLYMEHTFAYPQHPDAWANASPLTGEEVMELDAHCRSAHVELVPNQNSFGHLENWLSLPRYQPLAECPGGFTLPWGEHHPQPFSLAPTDPASLEFLRGLYDELLPHFASRLFNVGCDETYDVGMGRSKPECERKGTPRVYLEFLNRIHDLAQERGRTMLFWADMVQGHPEILGELPRDAVALEWGYEADHPFQERCRRLADAGISFYVCPGTGTLNAQEGRTDSAVANLWAAAEAGLSNGATGYLNTEWGDHGHWQHLPVSYLGLACGAAMGWARASKLPDRWNEALSLQVFRDPSGSMGSLAWDLGNVYQVYQRKARRILRFSSFLNQVLYEPADQRGQSPLEWDCLSPGLFAGARERIDAAMAGLKDARMPAAEGALLRREIANTARLARHACALGEAKAAAGRPSPAQARSLAEDLRGILAEHRALWLLRNRIGGLEEKSCVWFLALIDAYDRLAAG